MLQPFVYLQINGVLKLVNSHDNDLVALHGFTVTWGTDSADKDPEPSTCSITFIDRTGATAGDIMNISGAKIIIQLSHNPTWNEAPRTTYRYSPKTWYEYSNSIKPIPPDQPKAFDTAIFCGTVTTGGEISIHGNGYAIQLTATSNMAILKRLRDLGPLSPNGNQWEMRGDKRIEYMANSPKTPLAITSSALSALIGYDAPLAGYTTDQYYSWLEILQKTFAHMAQRPMFFEYPYGISSILRPLLLNSPVTIGQKKDGTITVAQASTDNEAVALHASTVQADPTLTIPEPLARVVLQAQKATSNDGKIQYEQANTQINATNITASITETSKSLTVETDLVIANTSQTRNIKPYSISSAELGAWRNYITMLNTHPTQNRIVFTSRKLNPETHRPLFSASPSGAQLILGSQFDRLTNRQGLPLSLQPFTTIGGVITFTWENGTPTLQHEVSIAPLPITNRPAKWRELMREAYKDYPMTWAIVGIIKQWDK